MASGSSLDSLFIELDGFEQRMLDLAQQIVAQVFAAELQRRADAGELDDEDVDDEDNDGADVEAASPAVASAPTLAPAPIEKTPDWTRQRVIDELGTWLRGGNPVEAAFLIRNRQRALVTNAKKFFGRFDAALNAANLDLARRHPDGIPGKKNAPTT